MRNSNGFFHDNQRIEINGRKAFIKHIGYEEAMLRFEKEKVSRVFPTNELNRLFTNGDLTILNTEKLIPAKSLLTDREFAELDRKRMYVEHLLAHPSGCPTSKEAIVDAQRAVAPQVGDRKAPGKSTLSKWVKKYKAGGCHIMSLVCKKSGPKRKNYVPKERLDEIYDALHKYFLCQNHMNLNAIHKDLQKKWDYNNVTNYPSRSTFYDVVHDYLAEEEIVDAQVGPSAAKKLTRKAIAKYLVNSILERVEIDSAYISIGLLDEEGNYLGPAIITVAIDVYSRAILGISIEVGRQGESTEHIVDCLRNATLPKQDNETIPAKYRQDWIMYGKPSQIIADAGSGYVSKAFTLLLSFLDISRDTTKVRHPWKKPFIERFFGTLRSRFLQAMPGYMSAGSYTADLEPDNTLKKNATLTVNEFKDHLYHFIVNDYHHTPHKNLNGDTPYEVWQQSASRCFVSVPEQAQVIRMLYPRYKKATLDPVKGVQYENLRYHSDELRAIYNKIKKASDKRNPKVDILATHSDMSHITVIDPLTEELVRVKCVHPYVVPGMTLAETKSFNGTIPAGKTGPHFNYIDMTADSVERKKAKDAKAKRDRQKAKAAKNTNKPAKVDELSELMEQHLNDESSPNPYLGSDLSNDNFTGFSKGLWDDEE